MSFSDLSSDIICHIISYLRPTAHYYQFTQMRLLNKAFDSAVKKYRPYWVDILTRYGPKQIGENSVHGTGYSGCRIKNGQCRVASHYPRRQLIPVFNQNSSYGAYDAVLKWGSEKKRKRMIASVKRDRQRIEHKKESIVIMEQDIVRMEEHIEYIQQWKKKMKKK